MKLKISLIQFLTSLLAFITQVVLLRKIGPTLELDVFYIIFGYTVGLVGVISVSATFLVPSILNAKEKTKKIVYSGNIIIGLSIISLMLVCFGISIIITANLTPLVNLKEEKYYYIIIFLCISACATVITSAASAILNLYGRLYMTALSTSATPIFALVYLCIVTDPLIHEMCFFQMLGILGQSICLLYYGRFYWSFRHIRKKYMFYTVKFLPKTIIATFCFSAFSSIDAVIAPQIEIGLLAIQSFSQRIVITLMTIVGAGAFLMAPYEFSKENKNIKFKIFDSNKKNLIYLSIFSILAAIAFYCIGLYFLRVLLVSNKFQQEEVNKIVINCSVLLIGAGAMQSTAILFRTYFMMNDFKLLINLSLMWMILYSIVAIFLSNEFGYISLSMAYSISWISVAISLIYINRIRARRVL